MSTITGRNGDRSRGFSLPELLLVIAIIAILAAILIVAVARVRDNAIGASCEQNERAIAMAVDAYAVDHSGQVPSYQGPVNDAMFGGPGNPYFNRDDLDDPADGRPYLYTNGPGSCRDPNAEYQIIDQGGHSSSSLVVLLNGDADQDAIAFCSDRGLYATVVSPTTGAAIMQPLNPAGH